MDTFLFTLQKTNGIIIIWTLFSSPYRQQTELYLYGLFSLHLVDNRRNYNYMDTYLFTLQTTNGIILLWALFSSPCGQQTELYLYGHFSLHHMDNKWNYISIGTFLFTIWTTNEEKSVHINIIPFVVHMVKRKVPIVI